MRTFKLVTKWLFGLLFVLAGVNHFANPAFFVSIVPPYLPYALTLVYMSGTMEILLGALLLVPGYTRLAAWGLIVLLIAVFPANLHMALHVEQFPDLAPAILWLRLPLQALFIGWAWWYTRH